MNVKAIAIVATCAALATLAILGSQGSVAEETLAKAPAPKESPLPAKPAEIATPKPTPAPVEVPVQPSSPPIKIEEPKVEKTTILPDGKVLIENKKVTLRYADGKTEERFVKITATPVQKPVKKVMREKSKN